MLSLVNTVYTIAAVLDYGINFEYEQFDVELDLPYSGRSAIVVSEFPELSGTVKLTIPSNFPIDLLLPASLV